MSRDDVVAAVLACARKLGRPPSLPELARLSGITKGKLRRHFGGIGAAIRAAGLEPDPVGLHTSTSALLKDWAAVARKLGKLPSRNYYRRHGRYCANSINLRFGSWALVPVHFLHFCRESGTEAHWEDVLGLVASRLRLARTGDGAQPGPNSLCSATGTYDGAQAGAAPQEYTGGGASTPALQNRALLGTLACSTQLPLSPARGLLPGRPLAGGPLALPGLSHEPANESGVIFVFGMLAYRLGFRVISLQTAFPDCEAMREFQPGKWQRVRVEFEFESHNFKEHGHDPDLCDVIVCWLHNWADCPPHLEVVELSRMVRASV